MARNSSDPFDERRKQDDLRSEERRRQKRLARAREDAMARLIMQSQRDESRLAAARGAEVPVHKLIEGGEAWLPFALSRLKQLRATGLKYGTQRFIMPDGTEVRVTIDGTQHYVHLTGGGGVMTMDSGLIDLINTGENNAHRYESGIIKDVDSVTAYASHFTKLAQDNKTRTNPVKTNSGQVHGVISVGPSTIKGRVWNDTIARCFEAKKVLDGEVYVYAQEDADLYAKKYTAAWRPASNFTGKCRLYVQALYGVPMYRSNGTESVEVSRYPLIDASNRTGLRIPRYKDSQDAGGDVEYININTSSGVWMDAKGRHWLAQMGSENMAIYALKPSPAGKAARALLNTLPAEDRDRLEAYILSTSLPVLASKQVIPWNMTVNGWAMSYGWHWAWTNPVADIVINDQFLQEISDGKEWMAMRSTHYRLQITQSDASDGSTTFTATVTGVEGPNDWALNRIWWCIAEPGVTGMAKSTPKWSHMFTCDAPFYVFYNRDTLKVCRVSVTQYDAQANIFTNSSAEFGTIANWQTVGMDEGWAENVNDTETYYGVVFGIGEESTPELLLRYQSGNKLEIINKSAESAVFLGFTWPGYAPSDPTWFYEGRPTGGSPGWAQVYVAGGCFNQAGNQYVTYTRQYEAIGKEWNDIATVIVPFYDAEAIFSHHEKRFTTTKTGITADVYRTENFIGVAREVFPDYVHSTYIYGATHTYYYNWGPGGGGSSPTLISTSNPPDTTDVSTSESKTLIARGLYTATMNDLSAFHDPLVEEVGAGFGLLSGTQITTPVVISPGRIAPVGTSTDATSDHALVGWV